MDASASEIHRQPLRPPGFEEPLFLGRAAKSEIVEHLRGSSSWLRRADEGAPGARDSQQPGEIWHVVARPDGSAHLVRARRNSADSACRGYSRRRVTKQRVSAVIERWREVRSWWEPGRGADRLCFRLQLSDGAVVDLAFNRGGAGERAGAWSLMRVLD